MQPLSGNNSDKASRLSAIKAIQTQLQETEGQAGISVADNGVYSEANMRQLNQAGVKWISRVSETLAQAKTRLQEGSEIWQHSEDGSMHWFSRQMSLPQGDERWVVVSTQACGGAGAANHATAGEQSREKVGANLLALLQATLWMSRRCRCGFGARTQRPAQLA
jgi:hypothetical protein